MIGIEEKSVNGNSNVMADARLLAERKIFLEGEITQALALDFVRQVLLLTNDDDRTPVKGIINSPGGDVNAGLIIYDVLQSAEVPIALYCAGRAYSMGAVIFCAGRHGRYMLPHAEIMIHEPLLGGRVGGNTTSIKAISDSLLETRDRINRILAEHTGKTVEEIEEATSFDHYFSAEEAIAFGLADSITGFQELASKEGQR